MSDETQRVGVHISRSTIAKIESNARGDKGVTIDEAFALAVALNVPLPLLLLPVEDGGDIALTPEVSAPAWRAFEWMANGDPLPGRVGAKWTDDGPVASGIGPAPGEALLTVYLNLRDAHDQLAESERTLRQAEYGGDDRAVGRARKARLQVLVELNRATDEGERVGLPVHQIVKPDVLAELVKAGLRDTKRKH